MSCKHSELPLLLEHLIVREVHLACTVLLFLFKFTQKLGSVRGYQRARAILHVILPLTRVPLSLTIEVVSLAMSLPLFPITHIQVPIVKVALALTLSQVVLPAPNVLVVAPLLLVCADVNTKTVSHVASNYLPFILVTVMVVDHCHSCLVVVIHHFSTSE